MTIKMKKVIIILVTVGIVAIISIGVIAASKPSMRSFKEFAGGFEWERGKVEYRKIYNSLFYAIYEKNTFYLSGSSWILDESETYRGDFLNFTRLK